MTRRSGRVGKGVAVDREMRWMKSLSSHHMFLIANESEEAYAREVGYIVCDQDGNMIPEPRREARLRRALRYAAAHEFATLRLPGRPHGKPIVRAGKSAWNALVWATDRTLAIVDFAITAAENASCGPPQRPRTTP